MSSNDKDVVKRLENLERFIPLPSGISYSHLGHTMKKMAK
jgi:hypothetical protein